MSDSTHLIKNSIPERYALYYPYIHIRDANWLKASLLWFKQVRRIVPEQFSLNDSAEVRQFAETEGPAGPLLAIVRLYDGPVLAAKAVMRSQIERNLAPLVSKYARHKTSDLQADVFQIHRHKLLEGGGSSSLTDFLIQNDLAWDVRSSSAGGLWLAMNPAFGSAVMSVLALAVARNEGLDVVTSNERLHETLLAEKEDDVFDALLGLRPKEDTKSNDETADEFAQLVLTTTFDYTMLSAEDIKNLIMEEKDLKNFRKRVAEIISDIPGNVGVAERKERLQRKRDEILNEWEQYRRFLPSFARRALIETSAEQGFKEIADHLPAISTALSTGTATAHFLGSAPGFAISVVTLAGIKMWKDMTNPLKFLTRIEKSTQKAWKKHAASLYLPQWSKLS